MKYIASCSFGKDSIAAIITWLENGHEIDHIVYAKIMFDDNTSAELPEHEKWIHEIAIPKLKKEWGLDTVIVQAKVSYKQEFYRKRKKGVNIGAIYGFPTLQGPWCNSVLKRDPIKKYEKSLGEVTQIIGIAVDEVGRIKNKPNVVYPLVDYDITEAEAFEICEKYGLLSPEYSEQTRRLGCWFCHNQRIGELKRIRKEYPDFWKKLLEIDKDSPVTFKPTWTVKTLDERFEEEDKQISML